MEGRFRSGYLQAQAVEDHKIRGRNLTAGYGTPDADASHLGGRVTDELLAGTPEAAAKLCSVMTTPARNQRAPTFTLQRV